MATLQVVATVEDAVPGCQILQCRFLQTIKEGHNKRVAFFFFCDEAMVAMSSLLNPWVRPVANFVQEKNKKFHAGTSPF